MGKIFFASDFHLGVDTSRQSSRQREQKIVRWLDQIRAEADIIYLVGDVFDYWFEYQTVVPKGYVRILGKLAELREAGIDIFFFTGNHDMWMFRYFKDELDIPIYRHPIRVEHGGKTFFIGHGDGLGPGDRGYKFIKRVFSNPLSQWMFARLHPNLAIRVMRYWSGKSRDATDPQESKFLGPEREWLVQYANDTIRQQHIDYFIFGHRHLPIDYTLDNGRSRYINLGDWLSHDSYAVFDGEDVQVKFFENEQGILHRY